MKFTHSVGCTIYTVGERQGCFWSSTEKPGTKVVTYAVNERFEGSFRAVVDDFGSLVRV